MWLYVTGGLLALVLWNIYKTWAVAREPAGHKRRMRRADLPQRLNYLSAVWFWITICGVFYCGLGVVLPAVYADFSDAFLLAQHVLCYFMFAQMIINWVCVKYLDSPFSPDEHLDYLSEHAEEIANGGYEINMNHLRSGADAGSYAIPMNSVKPMGGHQGRLPSNTTMYMVEVDEVIDGELMEHGKKVVYPYWAWKPCVLCQCQRPPRAHHCPICNRCVLKRDHHCFFTGSCVGLKNQRHFVVFTFWASIATLYCLAHSVVYFLCHFLPQNSWWDLLLPVTVVRWLMGAVSGLHTTMVALLYSLSWFCLTTLAFFCEQLKVIRRGLTSFENDTDIKVTSMASSSQHIRGVFGDRWLLNFLFPTHFLYPGTDDGIRWDYIKTS